MATPLLTPSDSIAALQTALRRSLQLPPRSTNSGNPLQQSESNSRPQSDDGGDEGSLPLNSHQAGGYDNFWGISGTSKPPSVHRPPRFTSNSADGSDTVSLRSRKLPTCPPVPARNAAVEEASNVLRLFAAAANHRLSPPSTGTPAGSISPQEQAILTLKLVKILCAKHRQVKSLKATLKQKREQESRHVSTVLEGTEASKSTVTSPPASRQASAPIRRPSPIRTRPPRPHVVSCAIHTPPYAPHGANYESTTGGSYPAPRLYRSTAVSVGAPVMIGPVCRVSSVRDTPPPTCPSVAQMVVGSNEAGGGGGGDNSRFHSSSDDSDRRGDEQHIVDDLRDLRHFIDTLRHDLRQTLAAEMAATHSDTKNGSRSTKTEGNSEKSNRQICDQQTQTSPVARNAHHHPFPKVSTVLRPMRYASTASGLAPELGIPPSPRPHNYFTHRSRSPRPIKPLGSPIVPPEPGSPDDLPRPRLSIFYSEHSSAATPLHRPNWGPENSKRQSSDYDSAADERRRRHGLEMYFAELQRNHAGILSRRSASPRVADGDGGASRYTKPSYRDLMPPNYSPVQATRSEYRREGIEDALSPTEDDTHSTLQYDATAYDDASPLKRGQYYALAHDDPVSASRRIYSDEDLPQRASSLEYEALQREELLRLEAEYAARLQKGQTTPEFAQQVAKEIKMQAGNGFDVTGALSNAKDVVQVKMDLQQEPPALFIGSVGSPVAIGAFESPAERYRQLHILDLPEEILISTPSANPPSRDYRRLVRPVAGSPRSDGLLSPPATQSPDTSTGTASPFSPPRSSESPGSGGRGSPGGMDARILRGRDLEASPTSTEGSPLVG